jgi:2-aminoadipate transaminase
MKVKWDELYAARARWTKDSDPVDFRRILADPEMISFFAGLPDPELYPVEDVKTALDRVLTEDGRGALQYAPPVGYGPLKTYLAEKLRKAEVPAKEENMLILSGSIQGVDLVAEMLLDPDDTVVVEDPTFSGAIQIFDKYGARYATVPVDDEGLRVDLLPDVLEKQQAKFMYLMPNFHNPTGVSLSVSRRRRLLEISHEFGLPLVTDDPYGELRYKGEPLPYLRALDGEADVIMISSFSKILAPGLRLGWLLAPDQAIEKLQLGKLTADRSTNHLSQRLVYEMGRRGMLDRYLQTMIAAYGQKLEAILTAMQDHFPPEVKWTEPRGGYFVWVTLPQGLDAGLLMEKALAEKVFVNPGASCFARGGGENTLRLCFVNTQLDLIPQGIKRLGRVIRGMMGA